MSSKFIALPVTQGDCFYLERNDKVILFDGGRYPQFTPGLFKEYTSKNMIDYLICSHNDADHALGIIGILGSGITVKEVWLPGRWLDVISEIHTNEYWFYDIFKSSLNCKESTLEELANNIFEDPDRQRAEETSSESLEIIEQKIEELCEVEIRSYGNRKHPLIYPRPFNNIFKDAISAADRIIEIAKIAYANGSKIRWFDHSMFIDENKPAFGGEKLLKPQNSVEILTTFKRTIQPLLYKMALTVSNRESLVFLSEFENEPKVLFTADSDLFKVTIPAITATNELLVTAPHHGSESNQNVYNLFSMLEPLLVRSDMKSRKRPCKGYRKLSSKYCTLCDNSHSIRGLVEFHSSGNTWLPMSTKCKCK